MNKQLVCLACGAEWGEDHSEGPDFMREMEDDDPMETAGTRYLESQADQDFVNSPDFGRDPDDDQGESDNPTPLAAAIIQYDGRSFTLTEREMNAFAESYGPEVAAGNMDADDATYLFLLNLGRIAPVGA